MEIILRPDSLIYWLDTRYQAQREKGITQVTHFGVPATLALASGHLILAGTREKCELIDGRNFTVVTKDWDEAHHLMAQVTESEQEAYDLIIQDRIHAAMTSWTKPETCPSPTN
jgi:hypothetical protein